MGHMSENFENKRHLASLESLSNLIYTSVLSFDHLGMFITLVNHINR